ncbi:helix-turn-helix domain-containing protein, partial [Actinotignum schaalii]|uniref:helix-turn-helix domain-containing protein n=1 Tax=Actinotignum TaxID=1653174 RepID=UPI00237DEC84|nr:helix-turn-helix transcriptional regulator [Actinotignum sanguinis]MDE1552253.1 helix-turn-helix transcriptional regulator [Actinotignum sanguinis]
MNENQNGFIPSLVDSIAAEVRAEMARKKQKISTLSESIGMHPNVLGRKVRGDVEFTSSDLAEICLALNVPLPELLRRAEEAAKKAKETN